ncbi:MAG: IclR family transcriptional regulator [Actinobacteria bacterium]|nr:IclR family transcriptional regulator [Actinomycetota bacterium]
MDSIVSGVGVVDKSAAILEAVHAGAESLSDLVAATGMSRATTHRIAGALASHGLLRRTDRGGFALGWRLVVLGRAAESAHGLVEVAAGVLAALRDETGESTQLYVRDGDRRVCVAACESSHGLRTIVGVGAVLPIDKGSAGHVLAGRIPRDGWVASVGEREVGVASVSAPVRDATGAIVAAVSISGPVDRVGREPGRRYGNAVLASADRLGAALAGGGRGAPQPG